MTHRKENRLGKELEQDHTQYKWKKAWALNGKSSAVGNLPDLKGGKEAKNSSREKKDSSRYFLNRGKDDYGYGGGRGV